MKGPDPVLHTITINTTTTTTKRPKRPCSLSYVAARHTRGGQQQQHFAGSFTLVPTARATGTSPQPEANGW